MEKQTCFIFFCLFVSIIAFAEEVEVIIKGSRHHHHHHHHNGTTKLFVFGDSYADTGNWPEGSSSSWKEPYGINFPGKPSGRFSNGRVLTDYIVHATHPTIEASFLGIKSPTPYQHRKLGEKTLEHGMNFAYGGTGVFNTLVNEPNMTTQINFFQQVLLGDKTFTKQDLNSSIALVSVAGNDYATYMALNGSLEGFPDFTESVVHQLGLNLKRIHGLGVRKIGVTAMEPRGCLPQFTASASHRNCSQSENSLAKFHNELLKKSLEKLSNESSESVFVILDLYSAFMSALKMRNNTPGTNSKFENPLKPCCVGTSSGEACGSVDVENGKQKYSVCNKPLLSFFWDVIHPSQEGWHQVYLALRPSLHPLII